MRCIAWVVAAATLLLVPAELSRAALTAAPPVYKNCTSLNKR
jgi:hypothetical protein